MLSTKKIGGKLGKYIIFIFLAVFCVVLSVTTSGFLTEKNIINVLRQVSYNGVIAVGMTFVIITGNIDLSVGGVVGLAAIVACDFAHPGEYPLIIPILVALGIGALVGLINGIGIAYGHVPAFIMTLGTNTILRGVIMLYNNGKPVLNLSEQYQAIGSGYLGKIPIPVIILIAVLLLGWFILNKTRFGRHVLAVGGNEQAARVSGINTKLVKITVYIMSGIFSAIAGMIISARVNAGSPTLKLVKITVYIMSGIFSAIAGMIISARVNAGSPTLGTGYENDAIAAAVIGGTSMMGGQGSMIGTIGGILIIGVMNNGLDLLNVSSYYQQVAKGIIIIAAVLFDMLSKSRKSK